MRAVESIYEELMSGHLRASFERATA
jgi:hypothetical protein